MAGHGCLDLVSKPVGFQRQHGEAVVATVESAQPIRQSNLIDTFDFADPGVEFDRLETAALEPTAPFA